MTETRTYPTLHVASAITGVCICEGLTISRLHEITGFLAGHDVWTHELGNRAMMQRIFDHAREQFPEMPTKADVLIDHRSAGSKAIAAYGEMAEVRKGTLTREAGPVETLAEMLR